MNNSVKINGGLNVCLLNDSFPPVIDGVANAVLNYANIIQNKYGEATVATPWYPDVEDNYDFPVIRYRSVDTTKLVGYRAGLPFEHACINSIIESKFEIIHSHCPIASTVLARTLREVMDKPIIITYHTKFDIDISSALESHLMQKTAVKYLCKNIQACDEVWAVSRGAGENLRGLGFEGDYIVMENGVDLPKGRADNKKTDELRRKYGITDEAIALLFVGRMMWYKGLRIVIDSLSKIKSAGINFKMIFVGDGADRSKIEEYAKDSAISDMCIFTGAVCDREQLRVFYSAADLFLFMSTFDTSGLVVREAAACALPSVLVKGSCAAEGIENGETGFLLDENAEALAAFLIDIYNNKDEIRRVGQAAMDRIYLSWEDSVKKAYDRYQVVIDNYRPGQKHEHEKHKYIYKTLGEIYIGLEKMRTKLKSEEHY